MKKTGKTVFTAGIIVLVSVLQASQSRFEWELKKESDDKKVYTRSVPGNEHKQMMVVLIGNIPFEVLAEVAKDYSDYESWYGMCKSLKFVNKNGSNDINMYFVLDMPLLKNRDAVLNLKYDFNYKKGIIKIDIKSFESDYQKDSGLVRMPKVEGSIVVTRESPDKTKVVYTVFADLSTNVPAWLINKMAVKHPYDTATGLVKQSKKEIYKERAAAAGGKNFKI